MTGQTHRTHTLHTLSHASSGMAIASTRKAAAGAGPAPNAVKVKMILLLLYIHTYIVVFRTCKLHISGMYVCVWMLVAMLFILAGNTHQLSV